MGCDLDKREMAEVKERIEAEGTLFSARHNRDYATMAAWLIANGGPELSDLDVHICLAAE